MNDWDRDNLSFLMNASKETLRDWAKTADEDDWRYAMELFAMANAELDVKLAEQFDDVEDLTEANAVLAKIMVM